MKKLNAVEMRKVEGGKWYWCGTVIYPGHYWWDINPWRNLGGAKYVYACTACKTAITTNSWVSAKGFQMYHSGPHYG